MRVALLFALVAVGSIPCGCSSAGGTPDGGASTSTVSSSGTASSSSTTGSTPSTTSGTGSASSGAVGCSYPTAAQLSGGTWNWHTQCDAGPCSGDSDCATGYFCDFTVINCSTVAPIIGTVVPGTCLATYYAPQGQPCETGEDCGAGLCLARPPEGGNFCTLASRSRPGR